MIPSARIHTLYASEKTRLAATGEDTHKTLLQGLRTLVHGELCSHHGADRADPRVWEQAAVAIRAAGLWRDPAVVRGSRPRVTPLPGPAPYRCRFVVSDLAVPDDFPAGPFEGAYLHALDDIIHTEQFTGAWIGMAYRFRSCAENAEAFAALFKEHGSNPPFEQRYAQDREMFEFHANGYGALDSLFYGMYFVAELVKPEDFDVGNLRKITAAETTRHLHRGLHRRSNLPRPARRAWPAARWPCREDRHGTTRCRNAVLWPEPRRDAGTNAARARPRSPAG
jgi:hypothetical protein